MSASPPRVRVIPIVPAGQRGLIAGASTQLSTQLSALPPLSLYVHFPWCVKKCPYCDFNSHEARGAIPEADYVQALITDLESALPAVWGRHVISIFIGGGTPSLLSPQSVDVLLSAVRARLPLQADAEITIEANPGTVDVERFAGYRGAGVNRLSLGVQSFNPRHLVALGRIHDGDQARRAVEAALKHFDNLNLDLMYALPEQSLAEAQSDLRTAASFGTPHLSAYHLTLEPNTPFFHQPPKLPESDLAADMQDMVEETLAESGFQHYETSAFARPDMRCRHNLNYWLFGDYIGIGAGAHGKISHPTRISREMRQRHPQAYLKSVAEGMPVQEGHDVAATALPFEFMMNALRLVDGFPARLFTERTGLALSAISAELKAAEARGLLSVTAERIAPTELGRRFLNDLLQIFLR